MEYVIVPPGGAQSAHPTKPRVAIGGRIYPLALQRGDDLRDSPRQAAQIERGEYGELARTYWLAAHAVAGQYGFTPRIGWRGIVNGLGDFAEVVLPPPVA